MELLYQTCHLEEKNEIILIKLQGKSHLLLAHMSEGQADITFLWIRGNVQQTNAYIHKLPATEQACKTQMFHFMIVKDV